MKKIFMFFAAALITMSTQAQTIEIYKTDGTIRIYSAKDVDRIGFSEKNVIPADLKPIDLGLPSYTCWANMNVGAFAPEQTGLYFAWGEAQGVNEENKDGRSFWWEGYKALEKQEDGAKNAWGNRWKMPTRSDFEELFDYCDSEWTSVNGVEGYKFTSRENGNSIFLPVTGYFLSRNLMGQEGGYYWTASANNRDTKTAYSLSFENGGRMSGNAQRCLGYAIRPVLVK